MSFKGKKRVCEGMGRVKASLRRTSSYFFKEGSSVNLFISWPYSIFRRDL